MNIYADQINEIEKYLVSVQQHKQQHRINFYGEKKEYSKGQLKQREARKIKGKTAITSRDSETVVHEISQFFVRCSICRLQSISRCF